MVIIRLFILLDLRGGDQVLGDIYLLERRVIADLQRVGFAETSGGIGSDELDGGILDLAGVDLNEFVLVL